MSSHIDFLLLGLGNGAVYAALAVAIVVVYRSSGVLNFATGAMALNSAQTYVFLRQGLLFVLLPFLPNTVGVGGPWGFWAALALTMVLSAALGLLLYFAVFRQLRGRSPLAKAVASLGVMILLLGLVGQRSDGSPALAEAIFPSGRLEAFGSFVTTDRLYLALTVIALALLLTGVDRFTAFGLHTRAASETEVGALISGLSPSRISAANWALSGAIVAVAGVLIAPITPLNTTTYTLYVVPAMAAAVIGRFTRVLPAVAAGLGIGMIQSEVVFLQSNHEWMPDSGAGELVPLLAVLVFLVARSPRIPGRGELQARFGDSVRSPRFVLPATAIALGVSVAAIFVLDGSYRSALFTTFIMAIFGLSLVVVTGYLGQISLAQLSIGGVAGFLMATFTTDWGIPFPFAPLLAALCATAVGVVIGLPALRVRGMFVAVVTLMLAVALEAVWFRNPQFAGGVDGNTVEPPMLFGIELGVGSGSDFPRPAFGLLCLVVLAGTALSVVALRRSRLGHNLLAVRTNERSAAAAGVSVVRTKLAGFAIGAFIAGLAGALLAYRNTRVSFESFNVLSGLLLFATTYVAGIASIAGGLIAGFLAVGGLLYVAIDRSVEMGLWYSVITGLALIVAVILQPRGIAGVLSALVGRVVRDRAVRGRSELGRSGRTPAATDGSPAPVTLSAPLDAGAGRAVVPDGEAESTETGHIETGHIETGRTETGPTQTGAVERDVLLSTRSLGVRYSGIAALSDVDLDVPRGSIVGLIGPNGAGKSTLLDSVSGLAESTGEVRFAGSVLDGPPHVRARRGIARTFQGLDLHDELTVAENVGIGANIARRRAGQQERLGALMAGLGLGTSAEQLVSELSQGQRQLVSIARALAGGPELLMLDEPAAGLDTAESELLGEHLEAIRRRGSTILLVEHDMALVTSVCDLIHVLDFGQVIASGTPGEIGSSAVVATAYLGGSESVALK